MRYEWKAAAATAAAASGIGFSSGRAAAMFFSQLGWVSWIGIIIASGLFGALCAGVCILMRRSGAAGIMGALTSLSEGRTRRMIGILYGLLTALTGLVMIAKACELAALTLPLQHARWMGLLVMLTLALGLNSCSFRSKIGFGAAVTAVCVAFYGALSMDPRPVRFYRSFETVAELEGSVPAALLLSGVFSVLCAAAASGAAAECALRVKCAAGFAVRCSLCMMAMLFAANAAVLRGGEKLLSMALPTVVLAARWGIFGYYICIFSMFLPAAATLTSCIGALIRVNEKHDKIPC